MTTFRTAALGLGLLLSVVSDTPLQAQRGAGNESSRLAQELRNGSDAERSAAIARILRKGPAERTADVRSALLGELARLRVESNLRGAQRATGVIVDSVGDHGLYLRQVIEAVSQDSDPAVIEPLCDFIDTGGLVIDALARFGEQAVGHVLEIASKSPDVGRTAGALRTLRAIAMVSPLTIESRGAINTVARARLTGRQHPIVVGTAAELGLALGDVIAMARVRSLANDASLVRAIGISAPEDIAWLQQRLVRLLTSR